MQKSGNILMTQTSKYLQTSWGKNSVIEVRWETDFTQPQKTFQIQKRISRGNFTRTTCLMILKQTIVLIFVQFTVKRLNRAIRWEHVGYMFLDQKIKYQVSWTWKILLLQSSRSHCRTRDWTYQRLLEKMFLALHPCRGFACCTLQKNAMCLEGEDLSLGDCQLLKSFS